MSAEDTISGGHDCGLDAAAYVLGALEPDELDAFRMHLEGCAACREEVATLQHVADALPASAPPLTPPPDLRRRVFDAVRDERKGEFSSAPARERAPRPRRRAQFGRSTTFGGALAAAAAAAAAAVVLTSGGTTPSRVINASVRGTGSAELILNGGRGELVVNHFPPPGRGRIYQVWLERGHRAPAPTHTLFGVTTHGAGQVGVAGNLHGVSAVLVTSEPLGGSPHPTRTPVITAQL